MLKKRLMGVVTVRGGMAVQSFGYGRYLPLGKVECLVENLDRWGADEILVQVIDRSPQALGPDLGLLDRLGALGLRTPLVYAGGVATVEDGVQAVHAGADRVAVDALLHRDPSVVAALADRLGAQAIIAAFPLVRDAQGIAWLDYRTGERRRLVGAAFDAVAARAVSEVMLIDALNEGFPCAFDTALLTQLPRELQCIPKIVFGGLSQVEQIAAVLQRSDVSAVAVGNFLAYREHAVQQFKDGVGDAMLRPAHYESTGGEA